MLTAELSEPYGVLCLYNAGVNGLGKKLQRLRKERALTGPAIAKRALGAEASQKQIKSFANYLSRLERGREDNPSLQLLEQLARGFGERTLSSFVIQLERRTSTDSTGGERTRENRSLPKGGEHGGAVSAPGASDLAHAKRLLETFSDAIDTTLKALDVRPKSDRTGTE